MTRLIPGLIGALVVAALLVACASGPVAGEDDLAEFKRQLQDYGTYLVNGEFEKWGALHAEDVVKMPPDAPPTTTREDMVANAVNQRQFVDIVAFEVFPEEDVVYGDLGYSWGLYTVELQPKTGGDRIIVDGKFLTISKRQPDGTWLITHDCFNSNVPPPPPQ